MEALVFADRSSHDMLPLTRRLPVSMLPINGKPLIDHSLHDLTTAGVRSAVLVLGEDAAAVQQHLGTGSRWNMNIKIVQSRRNETPTDVARKMTPYLSDNFLALRGDVYRTPTIRPFRAAANNVLATQVLAQINGRCAQLCLCRQRDIQLDILRWDRGPEHKQNAEWRTVDLAEASFSRMADVTDFYLTNVDQLERAATKLQRQGDAGHRHVFKGDGSTLNPESVRDGAVHIGTNCDIDPSVQLFGPVVIGDNVTVGPDVLLHACVVLPGTSVPPSSFLRNSVVTSEMVLAIDGSVVCRFSDRLAAGAADQAIVA